MINLIGAEVNEAAHWLTVPGASVHLYGKGEARPGRKMGHVTKSDPAVRLRHPCGPPPAESSCICGWVATLIARAARPSGQGLDLTGALAPCNPCPYMEKAMDRGFQARFHGL